MMGMLLRIETVMRNEFSCKGRFIAIPGSVSKKLPNLFNASLLCSLNFSRMGNCEARMLSNLSRIS